MMRALPLLVFLLAWVLPGALAMNKQELINAVVTDSALNAMDVELALDAMTRALANSLKKGGEVKLVGFGTFSKPAQNDDEDDDEDCDPVEFFIEGDILRSFPSIYPNFVSQYLAAIALYLGYVDANPLYDESGVILLYNATRFMETSSCFMQAFTVVATDDPKLLLDPLTRDDWASRTSTIVLAFACTGGNAHVQRNLEAALDALKDQALSYDTTNTRNLGQVTPSLRTRQVMKKQALYFPEELARAVPGSSFSVEEAERFLNSMARVITQALDGGDAVATGFGTFSVRQRAARTGRNPASGEEIPIKARTVLTFKPSKALKDSVK